MKRKQGNKKRVVYVRGGSNIRAFSWGLRTPLWEPICTGTSPYNKKYDAIFRSVSILKIQRENQVGRMGVSILHITISGKFKSRSYPPRSHHPCYIIKGKNLQNGANVGLNKDVLVLFLFLSSYLYFPKFF
jgi:hypothetical protein